MSFRPAIIFLILMCAVLLAAMQQPSPGSSPAATSQANTANRAESPQLKRFGSNDDAKALESDIRRMRALVDQMQTNLAFVDNTQSPLKHQFQLEIDIWRTLLTEMERRAQANAH
ncbi:MAG TPA: hypothetical protein VJW55_02400 [Candidatus Angelobacter sp.]|nr:hypothetical protein [Candidatus Angelobacter sp.]